MEDIKFIPDSAHTVYISSNETSYGIFCFNSQGDLFLNSDWGFFGFAWRYYGDDFTKFLCQLNPEYMVGKFEVNYNNNSRKSLHPTTRGKVERLCALFIDYMKREFAEPKKLANA